MSAFPSRHADKIWNNLYTVLIPDQLTLSEDYLRIFGTFTTGDKEVDKGLLNSFTTVMIPIARILEYYEDGLEVQIPDRKDMIQMHKDIESYLDEWRERITYDVNTNMEQHKKLITGLERLSKDIYNKASRHEVISNLSVANTFGITSSYQRRAEEEDERHKVKPNYKGISELVRKRKEPMGRF